MIIDGKEADCGEMRGTFQGPTGPNDGRFGRGDGSGVATNCLRVVVAGKHVETKSSHNLYPIDEEIQR
jgi:hypothetical protein